MLLPFAFQPEIRRLHVEEAISEGIYMEEDQLDFQWGDRRKYGRHIRSCHRREQLASVEGTDSAGNDSESGS